MDKRAFSQAFRRGLGDAIVELNTAQNKATYRDIVLRWCLRDISGDWQTEGTKGDYLYFAICILDDKAYFEQIIIARFLSRCSDRLFLQLARILCCYSDDGSALAKEAFRKKYDYFAAKGGRFPKTRSQRIDTYFQWDELAGILFAIDGFAAFKRYAQDAGESLRKDPDNRNIYNDGFVNRAKHLFGEKRVDRFIHKMYAKSDAIKFLADTLKADELSAVQRQQTLDQERITLDRLIHAAKEASLAENPRAAIARYWRRFMKHASKAEILKLANAVLNETDETVKGLLLIGFGHRPFPLEITPLLQYVQSDNALLAETAVDVLKEIKNEKIHDVAILLLETKGLNSFALGLLIENYQKSDDTLIKALITKSARIPHSVQQDIKGIYLHHCSVNAFPALLRVYQLGECSFCRQDIVQAMSHCRVLPEKILENCLYDSYDDTRRFAKRLLARRHTNRS